MALSFLKKESFGLRDQLTFSGVGNLEIFIPAYFFDEELAEIVGENVESMGLFWFRYDGKFYELQLPLKIMFSFSETESKKGFILAPKVPAMDFDVFKLRSGDAFVYDLQHKKSPKDINLFINKMVEGAKMPPYVNYDETMNIFFKALMATDIQTGLKVPSVSLEFLISELYRDKNNMSDEFRFAYNGRNSYDYKMVRITKVPELLSSFVSLTGEDNNSQIMNSVIRGRENKKEKYSPMEKITKY